MQCLFSFQIAFWSHSTLRRFPDYTAVCSPMQARIRTCPQKNYPLLGIRIACRPLQKNHPIWTKQGGMNQEINFRVARDPGVLDRFT